MTTATALMSLADAAERLQVDRKTVRRWIAAGRLTGYRVGGQVIRLDAAEVDALLQPIPTRRARIRTDGTSLTPSTVSSWFAAGVTHLGGDAMRGLVADLKHRP